MSNLAIFAALMLSSFLSSAILTRIFISSNSLLDHPNERSLHSIPVPRNGGLSIVISILFHSCIVLYWYSHDVYALYIGLGLVLIATVSFCDDHFDLSAKSRIIVHILAAWLLIKSGLAADVFYVPGLNIDIPMIAGILLTLFFIVWMINLYNFMDGMDGLSGGMGVIGFGGFACLAFIENDLLFSFICMVIVFSIAGFLIFNFPPARIFMGDVGASSLGFLLAAMSLWGEKRQLFQLWEAVLLFSPFIVDATVTLLRRIVHGEKIWQAHKSHYYQQLVLSGWGHKKTVLFEYAVMLACAITVVAVHNKSHEAAQISALAWLVFYLVLVLWIPKLAGIKRK